MKEFNIDEMPNYHKINSCVNCKFVIDSGVDEEYLECFYYYYDPKDNIRAVTQHDYICDKYEGK